MKKSLSKAEWSVMSALWEKPEQTMAGIIAAMGNPMDWKYNTYATYVSRLCDKGLIGYRRLGRDNFYFPLVGREECFMAESRDILDKFSHSAKDLMVYMIRDGELSAKDRKELRALLDELEKEDEKE